MPSKTETKHQRFVRLALRRLERSCEELRLLSQLASSNYENTPEEAQEIVRILDERIRHIAEVFEVEYATRIGKASTQMVAGAQQIHTTLKKVSILDEVEIMHALEHLRAGRTEEVERILRGAVTGKRAT